MASTWGLSSMEGTLDKSRFFAKFLFLFAPLMVGCAGRAVMYPGPRLSDAQKVVVNNLSPDFWWGGDSVSLSKVDDFEVPSGSSSVELSPGVHVLWVKFYRPPEFFSNTYKTSANEGGIKFISSPGEVYRVNAFVGEKEWNPYLEDMETGEIVNLGQFSKELRIVAAPRPSVPFHGQKRDKPLVVALTQDTAVLETAFRAGAYNAFRNIFPKIELVSSPPTPPKEDYYLLTIHPDMETSKREDEDWRLPFNWVLTLGRKAVMYGDAVARASSTGNIALDVSVLVENILENIGAQVSPWATSSTLTEAKNE